MEMHKFILKEPIKVTKEQLDIMTTILELWVITTDNEGRISELEHSNLFVISTAMDELCCDINNYEL